MSEEKHSPWWMKTVRKKAGGCTPRTDAASKDTSCSNCKADMPPVKKTNTIMVLTSNEGQCVTILTEAVATHAEWIKGEGADICLYRALDDNRLVGALLPLRNWNGQIVAE